MREPSTLRSSWEEWKQRCAIGLCGSAAGKDLTAYGGKVMAGLWRKFSAFSDPCESDQHRWHLFESYMHACSARTGKRWKDWLFEKAEGSSDPFVVVLEKEAYECMDTTIRKYCLGESHRKANQAGARINSLNEPVVNSTESTLKHEDVLAGKLWEDPSQMAAWKELERIAWAEAKELFSTLDQAGKTVLLANYLELSLGEPSIEQLAGVKKSALYRRGDKILETNKENLQAKYSSEDPRTLRALVALAEEALSELGFEWGKSEKLLTPNFTLA
jgi:hypothetical protein